MGETMSGTHPDTSVVVGEEGVVIAVANRHAVGLVVVNPGGSVETVQSTVRAQPKPTTPVKAQEIRFRMPAAVRRFYVADRHVMAGEIQPADRAEIAIRNPDRMVRRFRRISHCIPQQSVAA